MDDSVIRGFIGLLKSLPAVTDMNRRLERFPGPDLAISDMSGIKALDQNWGPDLGSPKCVRVASGDVGNAFILPKDSQGGMDVQLQCDLESLRRLKDDAAFTRYASFKC